MIGQKSFEIGPREWLSGMTTAANTTDGGFSPETTMVNITAVPGVLYPPGALTDKSGSDLNGSVIASCEDSDTSNDRYLLSIKNGGSDGYYYTYNSGSGIVARQIDTTNSYSGRGGITSMVQFATNVFATTATEIVKLTNNLAAIDATWWTVTQSKTLNKAGFHPMLVFEAGLYIGNGNELCFWDNSTSTQTKFSTVNTDDAITALGIDPGSGKMLVAVTIGQNASDVVNTPSRVLYYDGVNNKALRVVPVEDVITAFYNVGGTLFVVYGNNLGYWTGNGIRFIRKFNFAVGDFTVMAYPQHITNTGKTLLVIDGTQVFAYGEIIGARGKVPRYILKNQESASLAYQHICNLGQGVIGLGFATSKFYIFDTKSTAAVINGGCQVYSKRYTFPKMVNLNAVVIELDQAVPSAGSAGDGIMSIRYIDSRRNTSAVQTLTVGYTNTEGWQIDYGNVPTRSLQFTLLFGPQTAANVTGIRRMTVFYTPQE